MGNPKYPADQVLISRRIRITPAEWEAFTKSSEEKGISAAARLGKMIEAELKPGEPPSGKPERLYEWKQKTERFIRAEVERQVRTEWERKMNEEILPYHKAKQAEFDRVVKARRGFMPKVVFNLIRTCLHPDSRTSVSDDKLRDAFLEFNKLELELLSEKDHPTGKSSYLEALLRSRK